MGIVFLNLTLECEGAPKQQCIEALVVKTIPYPLIVGNDFLSAAAVQLTFARSTRAKSFPFENFPPPMACSLPVIANPNIKETDLELHLIPDSGSAVPETSLMPQVHKFSSTAIDAMNSIYFSSLVICGGSSLPAAQVRIHGAEFTGLLDSGANASFMSAKIWKKLKKSSPLLEMTSHSVTLADSSVYRGIMGQVSLPVTLIIGNQTRESRINFFVCINLSFPLLLGTDFMAENAVLIDFGNNIIRFADRFHGKDKNDASTETNIFDEVLGSTDDFFLELDDSLLQSVIDPTHVLFSQS